MFKIFINFKTYPEGTGEKAVGLAKILQQVYTERSRSVQDKFASVEIIPIVQAADVYRIKKEVDIPIWVQHLDFQKQGPFTGWQNLEAVIEAGASGTLLSHSEYPIPPGTVKQILGRIRGIGPASTQRGENIRENNKFQTMVCCKTLGQMERLVKFKPDYIGYEISELIGGKVSITDKNPKGIEHAIEICGKIALIVGAGIHKAEDLKKAKVLGASGVLISSAIVLAENPRRELEELIKLV